MTLFRVTFPAHLAGKDSLPPVGGGALRNSSFFRSGFTLLELSIVLAIIGVVLGGSVTLFLKYTEKSLADQTTARLQVINQALLDYRRAFNRIPCPGDITLAPTTANFGLEASTRGDCFSTGAIVANFRDAGNTNAVAGGVPVKALRLPEDYASDAWGRRFLYGVDKRLTNTDGFTTYPISTTTGVFVIKDINATTFANPVVVVLSFGEDGHGAYPRAGGSTRINSAVTNTVTLENCGCSSAGASATFNNTFYDRTYYIDPADAHNAYDDMITYKSRKDMRGYKE